MAKDSFLIYKSFYKPISRLSDKQLGRLFRAIFQYQLDGEATVEEDIEMAFEFFKNQFDIDESKYQGIVERNRSNGRKGVKEESAKQASRSQKVPNKPVGASGCQWVPVGAKQASGNHNDNDNVNDNELSSTTTRPRARADDAVDPEEEFLDRFFNEKISVEAFCMSNRISIPEFRRLAEEIVNEWNLTGQKHDSENEARKHLINQTRKKLQSNDTKPQNRFSGRRGADSAAVRPEEYSDSI